MNDTCNLCCKELNGLVYDLRNSKSEQSGIYLISLIENFLGNEESLQNIILICKECNDLLLELDILTCKLMEIQNVIKQYIVKRQQFVFYLNSDNINENVDEHDISVDQQTQIEEFKLFEQIIKNNCKSENIDFINDDIDCKGSEIIHHGELALKDKKAQNSTKSECNKSSNQYKCHCSKTFETNKELKNHAKTHSAEHHFVCELCGQSYKKKAGFEIHKKMHEGLNPFTCVYCSKSFTQKISLMRHVPLHTGEKPYQCEECGKRFIHHSSFSAHKQIHAGEKPHKCSYCNVAFRSSSHLTRHKRVHTGEKKFGCSMCGKRFAERYNLVAHQKIHTLERTTSSNGKHCCQICGEIFDRPIKLKKHKSKKHFALKTETLDSNDIWKNERSKMLEK